jgi:hypothetical protein
MDKTGKTESDNAQRIIENSESDKEYKHPITVDSTDEDIDAAVARVNAVLSSTDNQMDLPERVQRIMNNDAETKDRLDKTIAKKKQNPGWFVPTFVGLIALGAVFVIVYNVTGSYPFPFIGKGNIFLGAGLAACGMMMMTRWV